MWHMTCDMRHVTCVMWHMTCDIWHMACDMWNISSLALTVFWWLGGKGWLNESLHNEGVCRTAPATPGLLMRFLPQKELSAMKSRLNFSFDTISDYLLMTVWSFFFFFFPCLVWPALRAPKICSLQTSVSRWCEVVNTNHKNI